MILQAVEEFGVDLARSVLVGDKETDIQAGVAAGVGCNLLYRPLLSGNRSESSKTAIIDNLAQVESFLFRVAGQGTL